MSGLCRSLVKRDGHRQNASERVRGPARTLWRKRLPVPVNRSNRSKRRLSIDCSRGSATRASCWLSPRSRRRHSRKCPIPIHSDFELRSFVVLLLPLPRALGRSKASAGTEQGDQAMEIEGTTFGNITIDGKTYEHDVIIRLSGEVVKRKKKLSKKYYGTSHGKTKQNLSSRRDASSSFLARARWAMCIYRPTLRLISRKRAAKYCCSPPPRRSMCSTSRMRRRLGFFT